MSEKSITLKLEKIEAKDREKGKIKNSVDQKGEQQYLRNDTIGLSSLLGKFNTTKHTVNEWRLCIKLKDRLIDCYLNDTNEIELSLDQVTFLKTYLGSFDKEKDIRLSDFELRTLFGVIEQLT